MRLKKFFIYGIIHRIVSPNQLSRFVGKLSNAKTYPPLLRFVIRRYIAFFKIDMSEYDFDFEKVESFNQFFTRKFKKGARKWEEGISSPVDGFLLSNGKILNNLIFQVKGKEYRESELTGEAPMSKGSFMNLYLSPANYHRVHAPFDMNISQIRHIPGNLLSVSKSNAKTVDQLYLKNERVVLSGESEYGKFHFVFVGATNVGSIRLSFLPDFKSNEKNKKEEKQSIEHQCKKGNELGFFEMGSTIVFLIESDLLANCDPKLLGNPVKLGMKLV